MENLPNEVDFFIINAENYKKNDYICKQNVESINTLNTPILSC